MGIIEIKEYTSEWRQWPIDTRFGGRCVYPKSEILFSFGYLLVSFVYSKAFHLGLRIIFHLSLYLYPKVVFRYISRSIRFREQRSRRNQQGVETEAETEIQTGRDRSSDQ